MLSQGILHSELLGSPRLHSVEDLNLKTIMALEMCLRSGMWETFVSSIWDVRN